MTGSRFFLDANLLCSGSIAESAFARLVEWSATRAVLVSSDVARLEAERNLQLKRPAWLEAFERLTHGLEWVPTASFDLPVELSEKDIPVPLPKTLAHLSR